MSEEGREVLTSERFYAYLEDYETDSAEVRNLIIALKSELYNVKRNQQRNYILLDQEKELMKELLRNSLIQEAGFDTKIRSFTQRFDEMEAHYAQEAEVLRTYIKRLLDLMVDIENSIKEELKDKKIEDLKEIQKPKLKELTPEEKEVEIISHKPEDLERDKRVTAVCIAVMLDFNQREKNGTLTENDYRLKELALKRMKQMTNKTLRIYFEGKTGVKLV